MTEAVNKKWEEDMVLSNTNPGDVAAFRKSLQFWLTQFRKEQTRSAEWICRHNNDKNTFHKALELDNALREIRVIAREADMDVIVTIINNVLGGSENRNTRNEDKREGNCSDSIITSPDN